MTITCLLCGLEEEHEALRAVRPLAHGIGVARQRATARGLSDQ